MFGSKKKEKAEVRLSKIEKVVNLGIEIREAQVLYIKRIEICNIEPTSTNILNFVRALKSLRYLQHEVDSIDFEF